MTLSFEDVAVEVPADAAPETDAEGRYCKEAGCGNEVFRNGTRGRWPNFCDEHKKGVRNPVTGETAAPRRSKSNPAQAKQAADVLAQMNDLVAVGLMTVSAIPAIPFNLMTTASAIAGANDGFRIAAEEALATDAALCRSILRVGKAGGRAALAIAYISFGVSLAPAVMADVAAMRESDDETE